VQTFQSEAGHLIRQYGLAQPTVEQLGEALTWVLLTSGRLTKRHRRGHGRAWEPRVFYSGSYERRTD
jgi:hypothetical protein